MTDDFDPSRRLELVDNVTVLDREIWWRGCSILTVEARGPELPAFAATLGLAHVYDHPELVVVGASTDLAVAILAGLSDQVRIDDARYGPWSRPTLEGIRFDLVEVRPAHLERHLTARSRAYSTTSGTSCCTAGASAACRPWPARWPRRAAGLFRACGRPATAPP